ncbi:uncharacterized protein LOC105422095 isoform X2 [Pogonomyrmex barbatus]|nr:uncharacterized protein LOC105422095 isoform X2 [Pogonomyrmex barbatus]XP_011629652.1 uncharacterized protein LOC105422095 isoform X2 [Pogonomyrmex barbatus]
MDYTEKSDDNDLIKCLKQEAARWACILGESRCLSNAVSKLTWHIDNPTENKLLPWWKEWTFCNGLMGSNSTQLWQSVWNILKESSDNKFLTFLSRSPCVIYNLAQLEDIRRKIIIRI